MRSEQKLNISIFQFFSFDIIYIYIYVLCITLRIRTCKTFTWQHKHNSSLKRMWSLLNLNIKYIWAYMLGMYALYKAQCGPGLGNPIYNGLHAFRQSAHF